MHHTMNFLFSFQTPTPFIPIFVCGMLIHTFNAERRAIIAKLLQYRSILFFDNVLVAVVVALA